MSSKIYYVSNCPVCEQGLVRVRTCLSEHAMHGIFLCDECEAAWQDPQLLHRIRQIDLPNQKRDSQTSNTSPSDQKLAPMDEPLDDGFFGANTHWATSSEIALLGWKRAVKVSDAETGS